MIEHNVKIALRSGVAMARYGLVKGLFKLNGLKLDGTVCLVVYLCFIRERVYMCFLRERKLPVCVSLQISSNTPVALVRFVRTMMVLTMRNVRILRTVFQQVISGYVDGPVAFAATVTHNST